MDVTASRQIPVLRSRNVSRSGQRGGNDLTHSAEDTSAGLLSALYDTVGNPNGWSGFIEALAQAYPGGRGLLAVHDTTMRASRAQAGGGWEPDLFAAYNQHFVGVNPWIPNLSKRPIGRVVPAEFMLARADLVKTEFYQDFLKRAGLDSGVGVTVQQDGTRHLIVSVLFPHARAERDPDTVGRLQRLVPHLLRVAQLNRQFAGIETRAAAAEAATPASGGGLADCRCRGAGLLPQCRRRDDHF
jgi:hypothetical protein